VKQMRGEIRLDRVSPFLLLPHHGGHCFFQAIEGQFKHRKDLMDFKDGGGIGPVFEHDRIDPYGMRKGFSN